jgi:hypothetical protein
MQGALLIAESEERGGGERGICPYAELSRLQMHMWHLYQNSNQLHPQRPPGHLSLTKASPFSLSNTPVWVFQIK